MWCCPTPHMLCTLPCCIHCCMTYAPPPHAVYIAPPPHAVFIAVWHMPLPSTLCTLLYHTCPSPAHYVRCCMLLVTLGSPQHAPPSPTCYHTAAWHLCDVTLGSPQYTVRHCSLPLPDEWVKLIVYHRYRYSYVFAFHTHTHTHTHTHALTDTHTHTPTHTHTHTHTHTVFESPWSCVICWPDWRRRMQRKESQSPRLGWGQCFGYGDNFFCGLLRS